MIFAGDVGAPSATFQPKDRPRARLQRLPRSQAFAFVGRDRGYLPQNGTKRIGFGDECIVILRVHELGPAIPTNADTGLRRLDFSAAYALEHLHAIDCPLRFSHTHIPPR